MTFLFQQDTDASLNLGGVYQQLVKNQNLLIIGLENFK